ncbi:hypothetical protein BD410DRAFT_453303 [Rickenella mellea]|uniref:Uncharacterized protein n=1 Tax=Rickenella mellea TaxID=50990 RepID=A0A4Y7PVR8_9AGAM|nr:hypothetical protein BD410DRAFT_453303 [Rickenella mellea]
MRVYFCSHCCWCLSLRYCSLGRKDGDVSMGWLHGDRKQDPAHTVRPPRPGPMERDRLKKDRIDHKVDSESARDSRVTLVDLRERSLAAIKL